MMDWYILNDDGTYRKAETRLEGAKAMGEDRQIARDEIDGVTVSTVFLGLDHNLGAGPPLVFETMIFEGEHDGDQWRYSTIEEAREGHARAVKVATGEWTGEQI